MTVVDRIDRAIATRRLLDHPFYQAWTRGELTRDDLRMYAGQYYHWVNAFPTWLSATHANAPTTAMRRELLENLIDEERGADNHPELWLRFCDALGLERQAVQHAELLPETRAAIASMAAIARHEPAVASVAALYAYESQQPSVMKTKREGLTGMYGVTTGLDYFVEHEILDVEHSAGERATIAAHAGGATPEAIDRIDAAVATALQATYTLLDGVERMRTAH
jgi:pyrroloquinoline-quinone synthase